mmetsp:Transcript_10563/g.21469  ORF Transcript_10563/g.21469 Transcript_10563/m.21469 type:complete len:296 (-) Transcript_10563:755-1642(-)
MWGMDQYRLAVPSKVRNPPVGQRVVKVEGAMNPDGFFALHEDGSLSGWSYTSDILAGFAPLTGVTEVVTNGGAGTALHTDGSVSVWGRAAQGGSNAPLAVTNPEPGRRVLGVAPGWVGGFVALHEDGSVTGWPNEPPANVTNPAAGRLVVGLTHLEQFGFAALVIKSANCPNGTAYNGTLPSSVSEALSPTLLDTACRACAPGYYQSQSGQTICEACDAGTYQPKSGQPACIQCPAGKHQPLVGQADCTPDSYAKDASLSFGPTGQHKLNCRYVVLSNGQFDMTDTGCAFEMSAE